MNINKIQNRDGAVRSWLPEHHLARYVAKVIESLDLSDIERAYAGRGSDAYHPASLMSLLLYGYATRIFSSHRIEMATYDSVAFRYLESPRVLWRLFGLS